MGKTAKTRVSARRQGETTKCADGAVIPPAPIQEGKLPNDKLVRNYRRHTKRVVSRQFDKVIEKMAEESIAGSLAHTKYLFEIGGVREDIERTALTKREPSLAKLMLAEIRRRHKAELATTTSAGTGRGPGKVAGAESKDTKCGAK